MFKWLKNNGETIFFIFLLITIAYFFKGQLGNCIGLLSLVFVIWQFRINSKERNEHKREMALKQQELELQRKELEKVTKAQEETKRQSVMQSTLSCNQALIETNNNKISQTDREIDRHTHIMTSARVAKEVGDLKARKEQLNSENKIIMEKIQILKKEL